MIQRMLAIWSLVPLPFLNQLEHLEVHDSLPITDLTFVLRNSDESCHSDPSQFLCPVQESALVSSLFESLYSSLVPSAIPTWGTLEVEQAKQKPIPPAIFVRCDHAQLFHGSAPKGRKWIRTPYTAQVGGDVCVCVCVCVCVPRWGMGGWGAGRESKSLSAKVKGKYYFCQYWSYRGNHMSHYDLGLIFPKKP